MEARGPWWTAAVRPKSAGESLEASNEALMALSMWLSAEISVGRGSDAMPGARGIAAVCWTDIERVGDGWGAVLNENWWLALRKAMPKASERLAVAQFMWRCQTGRWAVGTGMGRVAERRSLQAVETWRKLAMGEAAVATRSAQREQAARCATRVGARSPMRWSSIWSGVR